MGTEEDLRELRNEFGNLLSWIEGIANQFEYISPKVAKELRSTVEIFKYRTRRNR